MRWQYGYQVFIVVLTKAEQHNLWSCPQRQGRRDIQAFIFSHSKGTVSRIGEEFIVLPLAKISSSKFSSVLICPFALQIVEQKPDYRFKTLTESSLFSMRSNNTIRYRSRQLIVLIVSISIINHRYAQYEPSARQARLSALSKFRSRSGGVGVLVSLTKLPVP